MDVRHYNAVDTNLCFACIRKICLRKMKNNIGYKSGRDNSC